MSTMRNSKMVFGYFFVLRVEDMNHEIDGIRIINNNTYYYYVTALQATAVTRASFRREI